MENEQELDKAIEALADSEMIIRVVLAGNSNFLCDLEVLTARHSGLFYHLDLVNASEQLSPFILDQWSKEPSIRGTFVRRMLSRVEASATPEERETNHRALRRGIQAFIGGGKR